MSSDRSNGDDLRFPPVFATNNPDAGETVAKMIRVLIEGSLSGLALAPAMSIASAYINPAGFAQIADQLERIPRVRLLLGAEVDQTANRDLHSDYVNDRNWLLKVLAQHEEWLKAERDLTGFSKVNDQNARRMLSWLLSVDNDGAPRVEVRRYSKGFLHGKAFIIDHPTHSALLAGSSNFTYAGLTQNRELNLGYPNTGETYRVQRWFDDLWNDSSSYDLAGLYFERWEPHAPWMIFSRMLYELYGDSEADTKVEEGLALTKFQRDGVARMLRLLDENGGVLVADEVGLGKTYLAGEVIRRAVEVDRQSALIVCPAALKRTVWDKFLYKHGFSRRADTISYDQLRLNFEQDEGFRKRFDDYALVVIDEAHNLRNSSTLRAGAINALLGGRNPKRAVLLTATPVNNSLMDLYNLISYFIKNDGTFAHVGIPSIREYIKAAQSLDPDSLSPQHLFDLMDQVAVRRTRRFIKKNYAGDNFELPSGKIETITFPKPMVERIDYDLDEQGALLLEAVLRAITVDDNDPLVVDFAHRHYRADRLLLARYTPSAYLKSGGLESFQLTNSGLLRSALLKRLESSPSALAKTFNTMIASHNTFLDALSHGLVLAGEALSEWTSSSDEDLEVFIAALDEKAQTQVQRADEFYAEELADDVSCDLELLMSLRDLAHSVADTADTKAERLISELRRIADEASRIDSSGISESSRRKTVIFSSFADTVIAIHAQVEEAVNDAAIDDPLSRFRNRIGRPIYGAEGGHDQDKRAREIEHFAPETAGTLNDDAIAISDDRYDLLFATDVLSEGVNLQQAGRMINYDLPWNPMRLVQRSGRIDRIGSKHSYIYIGCFFPSQHLDEMLRLEETLLRKLAYADAAIGSSTILPGQRYQTDVVLNDTREQIEALARQESGLFDLDDNPGALSGEEYRRRLEKAFEDPIYKRRIVSLPYGSGSGFISSSATENGFVFCMKMANHPKPWFRWVPVDESWNPTYFANLDGTLQTQVVSDILTCLVNADPLSESTSRFLTPEIYDKAFAAWDIASTEAHATWQYLTNPNNLAPEIEKAFRDAVDLVRFHGSFLGPVVQGELAAKLGGRWGADVKRAVREILTSDIMTNIDKIEKLAVLAEEYGLEIPKAPEPLNPISIEEVRLVAWMAVAKLGSSN